MQLIRYIFIFAVIIILVFVFGNGILSKQQKKPKLLVINVLDKPEYDDCHIKHSIQVPFTELPKFITSYDKDTTEIVVYCSNYLCLTSKFACQKLMSLGFKKVWAYEGGMAEWYQCGFPVDGPSKKSYLTKKVDKPHRDHNDIQYITAEELKHKMQYGGIAKW